MFKQWVLGMHISLWLVAVTGVQAAEPQAPPKPCHTEAHRAFDFWLGEWRVTTLARPKWHATSSITRGNGGCSVHESYSTLGGYAGSSVNFYDANLSRWQQTWIDNQGGPLYLVGGIKDGKMVLGDGSNEIVWTPLPDGRVRQHWQTIDSTGKKSTVFDGYYERHRIETKEQ